MFSKLAILIAAGSMGAVAAAGTATAGENWPASVVGTWNAMGNQSPLTITITNQAATGRCRPISGTILDIDSKVTSKLVGFYCPVTGRYHFVRNDLATGVTFQDYSGNVSDRGGTLFMGGVFAGVTGAPFVGEYSFFASK
jgi:hypothetical protein